MDGKWLPPADVTASRRPVLKPGEIERLVIPAVDLDPEDNPSLSPLKSGLLYLTTHRLIWIDERSPSAFSIPLASVAKVFPLKKSIRHILHMNSPRVRILLSRSPGEKGSMPEVITVVLRGKNDPEAFHAKLIEVIRLRSWEAEERAATAGAGGVGEEAGGSHGGSPVVGVSGILRKEQEMWESTDKSLQDAFQDLNALMGKAKEMVKLAEKMRLKLLSGPPSQANTANDEEMGSKQEIQDWLLSVGIASPVTKESAGALYHQQLSRELADFVKVPLEREGGMIALIDIYCHFNRARGTELISPEDLLQACCLWEKFDVPVMLRKFDSGVMVIQSKAHSDEKVFARINSLVMRPDALLKGISPSDAAMTLGIAPALAKEQLLAAESKGLLCRDISPEGFRFYVNLFREIDPRNMHMDNCHGILHSWVRATSVSG